MLATATAAQASLQGTLSGPVEVARRSAQAVGVAVTDVTTGEPVYGFNAERALIPASNTKLVTTAAAIVALGPGYQFVTPLLTNGDVVDGVLQGDLAVVGSGDPNLSARFHSGRPLGVFDAWIARLRELGIERVTGRLLLADGLFGREHVHPSWPQEQLDQWYEAPVGALSFNDNCVLVRVRPGRPGDPVEVELAPDVGALAVENRASTGSSRSRMSLALGRRPGSDLIEIWGSLPADWPPVERWITVPSPAAYFGAAFAHALAAAGITLDGARELIEELPRGDWRRVGELRSDLLTTIEVTNWRSQNFYAEALLKLLGARLCGEGSWEAGVDAVRHVLDSLGLDGEPQQADGSGMSRDNRLAAADFTALLAAMAGHRYGGEFLRSLPWGGQPGTTLEKRFRIEPYRGNVFAKTGYLSGVTALSGYAKARSGRLYAFSILLNGANGYTRGRDLADAIVRTLIDAG
ncbi:MAG: D-alanyl-D-alanine carboxypeptidase/D-alanyl-D-alanine endopeptidase [Thermoanaerobaculia bacterium]